MKIEILMSQLFGFSPQTYFNWKKDENKRPIISLLSQYFSKENLEEYLATGGVKRLDQINKYSLIIYSITNMLNNFDYFQRNVLYLMCSELQNDSNVTAHDFQFYFTINGVQNFIDKIDYFPNENAKNKVFDLYKSNDKKFNIDKLKKRQAFNMFEQIIKLNDVLIQILLAEYKTLINLNFDGVHIPIN